MFKDLKTLNDTINLTQMDKDTTDYLTLSDIYAFAGSDKKAIRMTHIWCDYATDGKHPDNYYIYTELGKVYMPRHLNNKLLDILEEDYYVNLMNRGELGIQVYRYQYENRHGYSVRFVRTPSWSGEDQKRIKDYQAAYTNWSNGFFDKDSIRVQDELIKAYHKEKMHKLYGVNDPYKECEYTKTPCYEHDCDLCPYNPYQE